MSNGETKALLMQPLGRAQLQATTTFDAEGATILLTFLNSALAMLGLSEYPLSAEEFEFVLKPKLFTNVALATSVQEVPIVSYEAEYVHAVDLIKKMSASDPADYLRQLVQLDNSAFDGRGEYIDTLVGTRLWHFRMYFLDEYIRYAINVLGGFASESYGLSGAGVRNYRGYVGGPFHPEYMPYRLAGS